MGVPEADQTILIIDDEEICRILLEMFLVRAGFPVIAAESGTKALEIVRTERPDVMLAVIDFNMPGPNGIQTFVALRDLLPDLKAILYTANADKSNLKKECPEGMVCLPKDFDSGVLTFLVRQLLLQP